MDVDLGHVFPKVVLDAIIHTPHVKLPVVSVVMRVWLDLVQSLSECTGGGCFPRGADGRTAVKGDDGELVRPVSYFACPHHSRGYERDLKPVGDEGRVPQWNTSQSGRRRYFVHKTTGTVNLSETENISNLSSGLYGNFDHLHLVLSAHGLQRAADFEVKRSLHLLDDVEESKARVRADGHAL